MRLLWLTGQDVASGLETVSLLDGASVSERV
jgi:hypothetical protein